MVGRKPITRSDTKGMTKPEIDKMHGDEIKSFTQKKRLTNEQLYNAGVNHHNITYNNDQARDQVQHLLRFAAEHGSSYVDGGPSQQTHPQEARNLSDSIAPSAIESNINLEQPTVNLLSILGREVPDNPYFNVLYEYIDYEENLDIKKQFISAMADILEKREKQGAVSNLAQKIIDEGHFDQFYATEFQNAALKIENQSQPEASNPLDTIASPVDPFPG